MPTPDWTGTPTSSSSCARRTEAKPSSGSSTADPTAATAMSVRIGQPIRLRERWVPTIDARTNGGCRRGESQGGDEVRVVAGSAKGVRLAPVPAGTRPMSDRAREGLFSSLGGFVEGAHVLDLFAGTGAIGIEALSRGASGAVFVDSGPAAVKAITENLRRT